MTVVRHPAFDHVTRDVPAAEVDRWVDAGWLIDNQPEPSPAVDDTSDSAVSGPHLDDSEDFLDGNDEE